MTEPLPVTGPVPSPARLDPLTLLPVTKREIEFWHARDDIGFVVIHDNGAPGYTLAVFHISARCFRVLASRRQDRQPRYFRTLDAAWHVVLASGLASLLVAVAPRIA